MPKAILALRSYPLAILMALVLFVCSLLIATSSIGTISGGDDQGSGMGGTGRTGSSHGDSGFGGTGSPSPFLGNTESVEDAGDANHGNGSDVDGLNVDSLIEPFLQQLETETARIPEDMRPLIELQRNSPPMPEFRDSTPTLDVLDENSNELPLHARRLLDMADADSTTISEPTLEIQVQIPEATGTDSIERFRMEVAEPAETETPGIETGSGADTDDPLVLERLPVEEIAGSSADEVTDETLPGDDAYDSDRPLIPERIQRPELPPFQRMRPAVDRASITPPRPRPMQI